MKVLVVDDARIISDFICEALERPGVQIDRAETCSEAYGLLEDNVYDKATLDMNLPDGTGIDILREIRIRHPNTRVAMISLNMDQPDVRKEALAQGAEVVLPKPFSKQDLVEFIYGAEAV